MIEQQLKEMMRREIWEAMVIAMDEYYWRMKALEEQESESTA
jgi:hypothetical protein